MKLGLKNFRAWLVATFAACAVVAAADVAVADSRILSVDDVLQVKVVNQADLDTTTRVELDGTISFPYLGRLKAAGRSKEAVARDIENALKKQNLVKDPQVLVEIATFGAQVSIQGAVGAPGAYTIDRNMTLTQALAKAGGLKDLSSKVVLRRHNGKALAVTSYNGRDLASGAPVMIRDNDEIFVEPPSTYFVYGYVNRAGEYPLTRELTVQQAIAVSGGIAPLGSDSRIVLRRRQADGSTVETPASLDDVVQPNDTIVVNERLF